MNAMPGAKSKLIPTISLVYLSIPILLFLIYWIKPLISIPIIALFLFSFYQTYRNEEPFQLSFKNTKAKITEFRSKSAKKWRISKNCVEIHGNLRHFNRVAFGGYG